MGVALGALAGGSSSPDSTQAGFLPEEVPFFRRDFISSMNAQALNSQRDAEEERKRLTAFLDRTNSGERMDRLEYEQRHSENELGDYLNRLKQTGGVPEAEDYRFATEASQNIFAPQTQALQQSFNDQSTDMNRLAARLGRSVDDPILQAKLRTGFMNQQMQLGSQMTSLRQQLAMRQPERRLGFFGQAADFRRGLASQAMSNRQAIMALGNQGLQNAMTGLGAFGGQKSFGPGGFKGALVGGMAGLEVDAKVLSAMGGMFGAPSGGGSGGSSSVDFGQQVQASQNTVRNFNMQNMRPADQSPSLFGAPQRDYSFSGGGGRNYSLGVKY